MEYISKESTIDIESALKGECIDSFGTESCKYNVNEKLEKFSKLLNNTLINEAISND